MATGTLEREVEVVKTGAEESVSIEAMAAKESRTVVGRAPDAMAGTRAWDARAQID